MTAIKSNQDNRLAISVYQNSSLGNALGNCQRLNLIRLIRAAVPGQ